MPPLHQLAAMSAMHLVSQQTLCFHPFNNSLRVIAKQRTDFVSEKLVMHDMVVGIPYLIKYNIANIIYLLDTCEVFTEPE